LHLVQAVYASGSFFGNALDFFRRLGPAVLGPGMARAQAVHDDGQFLVVRNIFEQRRILLDFHALVDEECCIAAVVNEEIRAGTVGPGKGHLGAPPVFFQGFALPGEHFGHAGLGNGRCRVILGGKNIAGSPADISAEGMECFDQHGRLNGHVQGPGDFQAVKRLFGAVFFYEFHQSRHFPLGKLHFLVAEIRKFHIRHFVGQGKVEILYASFGHGLLQ
jgi:hypothetical protein